MLKSNLRSALLGSGAAVAMVAVGAPASAGEIEDLKAQIDALQGKLSSIEARQDAVESSGVVAPAAAVEAGDKPKSWKLPGTNTSMNIGGYAKLDLIYDLGANVGDSFGATGIPSKNTPASNRANSFRAHARQSRVWFKTWTPTDWGELATHIEGDFFGGGGNQVVSNSFHLRMRHGYGRLGPVLAGQTWSNFMGFESNAETIDFGGPVGTTFVRQAQLRYTHVFGGSGFTASAAIENSETTGATPTIGTGGGAVSPVNVAVDRAPDLTGKVVYKHSKGVVVGRALLRDLGVDDGGAHVAAGTGMAVSDQTLGWGIGVNGTWRFGAKDAIGGEFNYGQGIGRYMIGATGNGLVCSAACTSATGSGLSGLQAANNWGGYAWYQRKWTDTIRTNIAYGYEANNLAKNLTPGVVTPVGYTRAVQTVHGNVIWSPVSQVNFGFEVAYGRRIIDAGGSNNALRMQIGMQYKF